MPLPHYVVQPIPVTTTHSTGAMGASFGPVEPPTSTLADVSDAALRAECARRGWVVTVAVVAPTLGDRVLAYLRAQGETTIGVLYRVLEVPLDDVVDEVAELGGRGLVARDENVVCLTSSSPTLADQRRDPTLRNTLKLGGEVRCPGSDGEG